MSNTIKKILDEVYNQIWTIAGTILVLITLSGEIQKWGIWIGAIALSLNLIGAIIRRVTKEDN